jgi:hypothetical protein
MAIFRLKDYKETMRALCGGAVKAIITSNSSHDILKMAGKLDEKVTYHFSRGKPPIFLGASHPFF